MYLCLWRYAGEEASSHSLGCKLCCWTQQAIQPFCQPVDSIDCLLPCQNVILMISLLSC